MPFPLIALGIKHLLSKNAVHHATKHAVGGGIKHGSSETQNEARKDILKYLAEESEEKENTPKDTDDE